MWYAEPFNPPDPDVTLRTTGRAFRVHKLVLSLASPIFRDAFSLHQPPKPASKDSTEPNEAGLDVYNVAGHAEAWEIVLRMIYPSTISPVHIRNFSTLEECLEIAHEYGIGNATAQLSLRLSRWASGDPPRAYTIAYRFGFADTVEPTSRRLIAPRKDLAELPSYFRHGPDAPYDDLNRERKNYLERVAQRIGRTPHRPMCRGCRLRITLTKGRSSRAPLASSRRAHLCGFNLFRCLGK